MILRLFQEPVTPTGGHKSEGVQNVLGRPPLNWVSVVLREAVQNTWDAREARGKVQFDVHWTRPSKENRAALRNVVFMEEPIDAGIHPALEVRDLDVLMLTDRGTCGLNGPLLANEDPERGQKRNFVDFVWEIGRSEGVGPGGGTYGYGKTSFFRLSKIRAVCVHSRCRWHGQLQDRFIAAHLGPSTPKLTGRSWWGETEGGAIRPMVGPVALSVAKSIGMPPFEGETCGTTIMILCPRMDDLAREDDSFGAVPAVPQVLNTLAESMVQWFWPKMIDLDGKGPAMRFRLLHEGAEIASPALDAIPPFNVYAEALQLLTEAKHGKPLPDHVHATPVECGRPKARLGHLVLVKRVRKNRRENSGDFGESSARDLFRQSHHVALLRKPMLVVKYLRCYRPPSDQLDYAGVFVADSAELEGDVEKAFALSEPATHDDWVPESLEDRNQKTYVRVAIRRIKDAFESFAAPVTANIGTENQAALGTFSEMLGSLIAGSVDGTGARIQPEPPPSPKRGVGARKAKVVLDGSPKVVAVDGQRCLAVPFRVGLPKGAPEIRVRALPVVLLEQGAEKEPPADAPSPRVHSFCRVRNGQETDVTRSGGILYIPAAKAADQWLARITLPTEARVRLELTIAE